MPEDSRYFQGRDHSEAEVAEVNADLSPDGIYVHADQMLGPYAPGGLQVNVNAGRAIVQGFWYRLPTVTGVAIPFNASGQVRYDRVVLRLERASRRVILALRQGAPGGPVPALQRAVGGDWELSLGWVRVGPSVTDITAADLGDERSFASVCGWAGGVSYIGGPVVEGTSRFAVFPYDTNTGFQNPGEDAINILCGLKSMISINSGNIVIGTYNTPTYIYGGGTAGAPQERIYADGDYIFLGRAVGVAGYGPHQIQIGTAPRTQYVTIGHYGQAPATYTNNIALQGALSWMPPVTHSFFYIAGHEGYYTGIAIRNHPYYNKVFNLMLGTAAGQGLGGSGDVSMYTAGGGAGRIILGTHDGARLWISNTYMAFGNQIDRTYGFNFQQAANSSAYGIRIYHNNQSHHNDIHSDTEGRTVLSVNDAPQMWVGPTLAQFTMGGPEPRGVGFNFQLAANHPFYGIKLYHTNRAHRNQYWVDELGRHTFSTNDVPLLWFHSDGVVTFGGAAQKTTGFNYQQVANGPPYGIRSWHTNQSWHADFHCDAAARMVLGVNDVGRVHIHPSGYVTIGAAPVDNAALSIQAQFGDSPASGIRLANAGASAVMWSRSDGPFIIGSAVTQIAFMHATNAIHPTANNVTSLGTVGAVWKEVHTMTANFGTMVGVAVNTPSNGQGSIGSASLAWKEIFAIQGYKSGGGDWAAISDERTKLAESIQPFTAGLDLLMQMEPIRYQYNGLYGTIGDREYIGFTAQHLLPIMPEMVETQKVRRDEDSEEEDIYTVDTTPLIFMLLNALKEHEGRLRALEGHA